MKLDYANMPFVRDIVIDELFERVPKLTLARDILAAKPREGWLRRGVPSDQAETILEHSEKVYTATQLYPAHIYGLNRKKMGQFAYLHDLIPETLGPDLTPCDYQSDSQKAAIERASSARLQTFLGPSSKFLTDKWDEYESQASPEARIVGQLDKLDAAVQAVIEEKRGYKVGDFFPYTKAKLTDPFLKWVFSGVERIRNTSSDAYGGYVRLLGSHDSFELERSLKSSSAQILIPKP